MDELTNGVLSAKLLEACGCDIDSAVYTFVPIADRGVELYTHSLPNLPQILDSAMEIFTGKKTKVAKNSAYYANLKKEQERFIKLFSEICELTGYGGQKKISEDKVSAGLCAVSHLYFDTFTRPIQFFLPHSSVCSGRWDFWDSIDFFAFKEKLQDKKFNFDVKEKLMKSEVWDVKFNLSEFPVIVQRRLVKEKMLGKKLNPEAMIKAMIIKMGEMGRPFINYEVIDFSIREFFTYLGAKKYQRVDREIKFLERLDDEIVNIIKGYLG